ncbi:MAG: hypothetical protein WC584_03945 [Candidatus Pacearchaeota archaeon]
MQRRIYNISDLNQLDKFKDISQEDANKILTLAYEQFTKEKEHQFPRGITDIKYSERDSQLVFEGKLIYICFNEDYYPIMFGGRNIPPLKLEFTGNQEDWKKIDDVYFSFSNSVREQKESLYHNVIGWKKQQNALMKAVKELQPK